MNSVLCTLLIPKEILDQPVRTFSDGLYLGGRLYGFVLFGVVPRSHVRFLIPTYKYSNYKY